MKKLVFIGTGGAARETYYGAKVSVGYGSEWIFKGFIKDPTYKEIDDFDVHYPEGILGTIDDYTIDKDDVFFCTIGDITLRRQFVEKIRNRGGKFHNLIHQTAVVLGYVELGEGISVGLNSTISCGVKMGSFSSLGTSVAVGHDVTIGEYCGLGAFTHIGGFAKIGDRTTVHTHSIIVPKVSIAEDTVIGANSLVIRSIKLPNQSWFGSPAKRLF